MYKSFVHRAYTLIVELNAWTGIAAEKGEL